jgi:biopolymer transport protein ExbB
MVPAFLEETARYFEQGGWVMFWLALASLVLWFALGYRLVATRRAARASVRRIIGDARTGQGRARPRDGVERAVARAVALERASPAVLRRALDELLWSDEQDLRRFSRLAKAVISVAPVLGLLGTVGGMIETFDSLRDMDLFSQSGGVAGGISQALFTTQLGLAVSIPGLLVHGQVERRAQARAADLAQIKDILCGGDPPEGA